MGPISVRRVRRSTQILEQTVGPQVVRFLSLALSIEPYISELYRSTVFIPPGLRHFISRSVESERTGNLYPYALNAELCLNRQIVI
jgi:hypothetical protein